MTETVLPRADRTIPILKGITLLLVMVPALIAAADFARDMLGAKPITELIHRSGDWSIRLLFVSLLITPLRQTFKAHALASVRRIIGVAAFCYIAAHLIGYAADEMFDLGKVASEIVLRYYLTIGFAGLVLMALLAATSTDGMVRRLGGKRWKKLHRLAYLIGLIAVVHFFMQTKLNVSEPTVMMGLYVWLMLYRAWEEFIGRNSVTTLWGLIALSISAALFTAVGEWAYYAIFTGIDASLVLQANLTTMGGLRPTWIVLAITLILPLGAAIWRPLARWRKARAA
ncbi:MAG TPA: protein-methionine-sulfoxide reductase heme-binding subunit MsrQ [Alphaproteobacteria bacterium]|nr:protein-methionine-sulfoxide reductase heme-binding subunit MsrQ [Alphaproteobacteria bacterium]